MNICLSSLIFLWLLPPRSCSAMTTGQNQLTTQEAFVPGRGRPEPAQTTNVRLQRPSQTFTTPPTLSTRPQRDTSELAGSARTGPAEVPVRATTPAPAGTPGKTTPTQATEVATTETSPAVATVNASAETSPAPSTDTSTASRPTRLASTSESAATGTAALGPATTPYNQPTKQAGQTTATTDATKPKKNQAVTGKKATFESNHGAVVGWVIGGTLVLMMLSFLLIYLKKRKLNEQQITTKNWAGPSPFIEDGGQDGAHSSHRISLSSFLPQRMSRKLSLLPESDEELEDINPGSTFGERRQEASSAQQGAGRETHVAPGAKETRVQADTSSSPKLGAVSHVDHLPPNEVRESAQG